MKLKKLAKCSLATALIFGSVGAISGCKKDNDNNTTEKTGQEKTYDLYVQYMNAKGDTPLTYEQWLASIKGDKGEDGISPQVRINETTNYWEISTDNGVTWTSTGVKATGNAGDDGDDGHTPVITIGDNGNWKIDGTDTGVKAQGDPGNDAVAPQVQINPSTNEWEISTDNGEHWTSTGVKATGAEGDDGHTPEITIGENGNWFINGNDSGKPSRGESGQVGEANYIHIKYAVNYPTNNGDMINSPSNWIGIYNGKSSIAPTSYTSYDWFQLKEKYTVSFDYNTPQYLEENGLNVFDFANNKADTIKINSASWIGESMPDFENTLLSDYFLGWKIKDNNEYIGEYDIIGGNVTLEAQWDEENLEKYFYHGIECFSYNNNSYSVKLLDSQTTIIVPKYYDDGINGEFVVTTISQKNDTVLTSTYEHSKLVNVHLPEGITTLADYSFAGATHLQKITFPSTLNSIGNGAFHNCPKLNAINIASIKDWLEIDFESGDSNPLNWYVQQADRISELDANLYINGNQITSITIPNEITKIKNYAFTGYRNLISLNLHSNITEIGYDAFEYTGIANLTLGSNVTNLKSGSFDMCMNLRNVTIDANLSAEDIKNSGILNNANIVYLKSTIIIEDLTYLDSYFTKQSTSDKTGYDMYVRNIQL